MSTCRNSMGRAPLTRRAATKQLAGLLIAAATVRATASRESRTADTAPPSASEKPGASALTPVVSFFLDQPYLDMSGLEQPYRPATALLAGQPLAELTEQQFRSIVPHA